MRVSWCVAAIVVLLSFAGCTAPPGSVKDLGPCGQSVVSSVDTQWTYNGDGTDDGAKGTNENSVVVQKKTSWVEIGAAFAGLTPDFIWKDLAGNTEVQETQNRQTDAVTFTATLPACDHGTRAGLLHINADNAFAVSVGDIQVGTCGAQDVTAQGTSSSQCFTAVHDIRISHLDTDHDQQLVVKVWNQGGPAMLQFRLDY